MVGGVQLPAYLHIIQISVVTELLDHERSHNFDGYNGYVINIAGLEDRGCK